MKDWGARGLRDLGFGEDWGREVLGIEGEIGEWTQDRTQDTKIQIGLKKGFYSVHILLHEAISDLDS